MLRSAALRGRLAVAAGCAVAALAVAGALRADLMVSHGFAKAFGSRATLPPLGGAVAGSTQSGDEGYWLTRSDLESPAPFDRRLAVGDRITIAGRDGRQRVLEVVDLKMIGEPLLPAVTGAAPVRLLLVTCHIVDGDGAHEAQAPVRFIVEGEPVEPVLPRTTSAPKA